MDSEGVGAGGNSMRKQDKEGDYEARRLPLNMAIISSLLDDAL
jgi:hypothetical protein